MGSLILAAKQEGAPHSTAFSFASDGAAARARKFYFAGAASATEVFDIRPAIAVVSLTWPFEWRVT